MFGKAQQADVRLFRRIEDHLIAPGEFGKGAPRALLAQIARHRLLQLTDGHRRAPGMRIAGAFGSFRGDEGRPLQLLRRCRPGKARDHGPGQKIERQRPENAMRQGIHLQAEQCSWPQPGNAEGAVFQKARIDPAGIGERGQKQRIGPQQKARGQPGHGATGGGIAPEQPAEEGRGELRHRGKGDQARLRQRLGSAGHEIIAVGKQQDDGDGRAPDQDQRAPHVAIGPPAPQAAAFRPCQQIGHHQIVAGHDGQRHRLHDHHGGGCGKAADEGQERHKGMIAVHRQGKHIGVRIHRPPQHEQARRGNRHHEEIDGHKIERKFPCGLAHIPFVGVFHHRHVKLPRQQQKGEQRQHRDRQPAANMGCLLKDREHIGPRPHLFHELRGAAHQPEDDENAHRQKGHELHDRFHRDRRDQAVLMFGGVDVAGAEKNGKPGHGDGHEQRQVLARRGQGGSARRHLRHHCLQRKGNGLQLQRDVGHNAHDRHQRHQRTQGAVLAIAGGDEVGDGGDVLLLGNAHHRFQKRPAENQQKRRADIDGQEVIAGARGKPHRTIERP